MVRAKLVPRGTPQPADFGTSRRALLASMTALPVAIPTTLIAVPSWTLSAVGHEFGGVALRRSSEGRKLSRIRYDNAEEFFRGTKTSVAAPIGADSLYRFGIVTQLALSAHLLDVGFADQWCARELGLNVARSLDYANLTGLGFQSAEFELLAAILSPYGKWRNCCGTHAVQDFPFAGHEVQELVRALLGHVRTVTGHPRPRGWRQKIA